MGITLWARKQIFSGLKPFKQIFIPQTSGGLILNMAKICPWPSGERSFENVNSCDIETKAQGHPLILKLRYFNILG